MPRVSVLLNCYNQAAYVSEAVESVLNQTFQDFELIITDNGSTDDTSKVLNKYSNNARVHIIHRKINGNVSRCFNEMAKMAKGEFISLLLSDDYYLTDKFEKQVEVFDRLGKDCDFVYGPILRFNQLTGTTIQVPVVEVDPNDSLLGLLVNHEKGPIQFIPPLMRRECLLRNPFNENVFFEGEGLFLRIAMKHKLYYDPTPTSVMRLTGLNMGRSFRKNLDMHWQTIKILESDTLFNHLIYSSALNTYKSRILRNVAWCNLRLNGPAGWSYLKYFEAIKIDPRQLFHKRILVGLLVGLLPASLRSRFNRFADRQMEVLANTTVVETYGGSS